MRILVAIKSCKTDMFAGFHAPIRGTWEDDVRDAGMDFKFFMGGKSEGHDPDEEYVEASDEYNDLPYKTREILKYSIQRDYDYTFLCDTDTYVIPRLLLKSGFEKFDYYGVIRRPIGETFQYRAVGRKRVFTFFPNCYPWASGGVGYFLSKKAAELIVKRDPCCWAEDLWVAQVLGPYQKTGEVTIGDAKEFECIVSWHFPRGRYKAQYDPKFGWMEEMYKEHR